MARPLRIDVPGGLAHVTARGNNRAAIFATPEERDRLLWTLERVVRRYGWICHAYVAMHNHYHLLVETPLPTLSIGMRQLNGLYAQWLNRRHDRSGHVFGGRFKSIAVESEKHLLGAARYIVLNPLRTRSAVGFSDWRWSSYQATAGIAARPRFLTTDSILRGFHSDRATAQQRYVEFVADEIDATLYDALVGEIYLGDEDFIRGLSPDEPIPEVPRAQWQPLRPGFETPCGDDEGLLTAYRSYGYRLREIATELGVHPATVSRALARIEQRGDGPR